MIRLRLVYDVEGWAFCHQARALGKHAPADFQVTSGPIRSADGIDLDGALGDRPMDVLFVMMGNPETAALVHRAALARGWSPARVGGWSSGWPLGIDRFPQLYRDADVVIVNNLDAWERLGRLPRTAYCPNGVDLDIFSIRVALEHRRPRVLWVGSMHHRAVKGYDDVILPLQERLSRGGIETDFRLVDSNGGTKRTQAEMAEWYNSAMVLVCGSVTEGTPNPALEAAACGCVVVSTPVGNMPQLIRSGSNGYLVERSVDAIEAGIRDAIDQYPAMAPRLHRDIQEWGWHVRSQGFFELFRESLVRSERVTENRVGI